MKTSRSNQIVPPHFIVPFVLITSLFALWGFANDITNPMVSAFKKVLELTNTQASLVQMAFYGGYFTMALPAAYIAQKYSYKTGILVGLALYATGALLFWPAAAYEEYIFFLLALYILTFGLAFLETTANPYILSMGSSDTATQRLNLAQAFNPMGALAGLYVAQNYILSLLHSDDVDSAGNIIYDTLSEAQKAVVRTQDLEIIRNPYVLLGVFVFALMLLIFMIPMPKTSQAEASGKPADIIKKIFTIPKYREGVWAQMFYVGAQIMCWTYIYQYAENIGISNRTAVNYAYWALGLFLAGRWLSTYLMRKIYSGRLMTIMNLICIVLLLGTIFIGGMTGLYCLVAVSFFMSLDFPTIYGIALEDLDDNESKFGAAFLVMAIVGGAIMPFLQGMILDVGGVGYSDTSILGVPEVNFSFILPLICFIVVCIYGSRSVRVFRSSTKS